MPIKCYNKPNRKRKRVFMPCDVARIAEYCYDDNNQTVTRELILALVAKRLGFTHIAVKKENVGVVEPTLAERQSPLLSALESVRDAIDNILRKLGLDV